MPISVQTTHPYMGMWSRLHRPESPKVGVLRLGGYQSVETSMLNLTPVSRCVRALADRGHPVISCQMGARWANDEGIALVTAIKDYAQANWGFASGGVLIFGESMGALTGLEWARRNPTLVKALALTIPVTNLAYMRDNNVNGYASSINAAYGGASGFNSQVADHNPAAHTADFTGFPVKLFASTDDSLIPFSQVEAFATAIGAPAPTSLGAVGHTTSSIDAQQVTDYLATYA